MGKDTHGEKLDYAESWPLVALVVFEALVLAAAIVGTLRQRARRG